MNKKEIEEILEKNEKKKKPLAGAAFSKYICNICLSENIHPNTNTPFVCLPCEKIIRSLLEG